MVEQTKGVSERLTRLETIIEQTKDDPQRLTSLEEKVNNKIEDTGKAIILARELIKNSTDEQKEYMKYRLGILNDAHARADQIKNTFATKAELKAESEKTQLEIKALSRLVYIGLGLVLAGQIYISMKGPIP